ncbi:MAG: glycoside hydrolase family 127 protein [Spirochaetales bacterium]|nr:glycoside hydrolase family 127 protein [Spirochaetales bacterium]
MTGLNIFFILKDMLDNVKAKKYQIRLAPESLLGQSQKTGLDYLLRLDPDRLMAPIYKGLGRAAEAKAENYGGWEEDQINGHMLGHYLSAISAFWQATCDSRLKKNLDYVVVELKSLQASNGYIGGISSQYFENCFNGHFSVAKFTLENNWVPWYVQYKIFAGLFDAFWLGENQNAWKVLLAMGHWVCRGIANMSDQDIQRMLFCEHGGMCRVLVDLYQISGEKVFLVTAERFIHHQVMDPLLSGKDELAGNHANTQIPKVMGLAKLYDVTADDKYRRAVEFFIDRVINTRSYVMGGNSRSEHFEEPGCEALSRDTCESCSTHYMLKLVEDVFAWQPREDLAAYYENALLNHILASQEPVNGNKMYFVPTESGHFKVYGTEDNSSWCCIGSGLENPGRYHRFIWTEFENGLYLNLFAASTLMTEDYCVRLLTDFPYSSKVLIKVERMKKEPPFLYIRKPSWSKNPLEVFINGEPCGSVDSGYLKIMRPLKEGDSIDFSLSMELCSYPAKDNPRRFALKYGPIVLAARLGREKMPPSDVVPVHLALMEWENPVIIPRVLADKDKPDSWMSMNDPGALSFRTQPGALENQQCLELLPFYALHHERYMIYFDQA